MEPVLIYHVIILMSRIRLSGRGTSCVTGVVHCYEVVPLGCIVCVLAPNVWGLCGELQQETHTLTQLWRSLAGREPEL